MEKDVISKLKIESPEQLIDAVENINTFYRQTIFEIWQKWKIKDVDAQVMKCYEKQSIRPLYLGIYDNFEWIDRLVCKHTQHIPYSNMPHYPINYRKPIHKNKRLAVWKKRNVSLDVGECFVCGTKNLNYHDFECGHIVSVYWGGDTTLENLEPICKDCNLAMGVHNLSDYKRSYHDDKMRMNVPINTKTTTTSPSPSLSTSSPKNVQTTTTQPHFRYPIRSRIGV
jgi:hypothetical protein